MNLEPKKIEPGKTFENVIHWPDAKNWNAYREAWEALFEPVERVFSLVVCAFDPGLVVKDKDAAWNDPEKRYTIEPFLMHKMKAAAERCLKAESDFRDIDSKKRDVEYELQDTQRELTDLEKEMKKICKGTRCQFVMPPDPTRGYNRYFCPGDAVETMTPLNFRLCAKHAKLLARILKKGNDRCRKTQKRRKTSPTSSSSSRTSGRRSSSASRPSTRNKEA